MLNNASYRQFAVSGGPTSFTFSGVGSTVRMKAAILAWAGTGATVSQIEPDPGNDGIWFMGLKVTSPSKGIWHYEYAIYNQNLDRAIQSFSVPLVPGVNISNIEFHAPPQHPGWAHDGTQGDAGYSSTQWNVTQNASAITWSTEAFAQNQNANAVRWGTLYNFRFDADQPPQSVKCDNRLLQGRSARDGCDPGTFRWRRISDSNTDRHRYGHCDRNSNRDSVGYHNTNCDTAAYSNAKV